MRLTLCSRMQVDGEGRGQRGRGRGRGRGDSTGDSSAMTIDYELSDPAIRGQGRGQRGQRGQRGDRGQRGRGRGGDGDWMQTSGPLVAVQPMHVYEHIHRTFHSLILFFSAILSLSKLHLPRSRWFRLPTLRSIPFVLPLFNCCHASFPMWCSGNISDSHSGAPGSIPGIGSSFFAFVGSRLCPLPALYCLRIVINTP